MIRAHIDFALMALFNLGFYGSGVELPIEARFDEGIKRVVIRKVGKERILSPLENSWDSFFLTEDKVSDDFLSERAAQN